MNSLMKISGPTTAKRHKCYIYILLAVTLNLIPLITSAHAFDGYLLFMVNPRWCKGCWIASCPPPQSGTAAGQKPSNDRIVYYVEQAGQGIRISKGGCLSTELRRWAIEWYSDWGLVGTNANEEARHVPRLASMMCGPAIKLSEDCKKIIYRDVKSTLVFAAVKQCMWKIKHAWKTNFANPKHN